MNAKKGIEKFIHLPRNRKNIGKGGKGWDGERGGFKIRRKTWQDALS